MADTFPTANSTRAAGAAALTAGARSSQVAAIKYRVHGTHVRLIIRILGSRRTGHFKLYDDRHPPAMMQA